MKPMCRGAGSMLSGFVEEKSGFLPLNDITIVNIKRPKLSDLQLNLIHGNFPNMG